MNGEQQKYYVEAVLNYDGEDCLIWPFSRSKDGYANMNRDGRKQRVQRLVCEDVYGPPSSNLMEAAHSCGRGNEGCVSKKHLRWATHADNIADKAMHGTNRRGEAAWAAKLAERDVLRIKQLTALGVSTSALARQFQVSRAAIYDIASGKSWGWLGA
jgi:hypothetical protein